MYSLVICYRLLALFTDSHSDTNGNVYIHKKLMLFYHRIDTSRVKWMSWKLTTIPNHTTETTWVFLDNIESSFSCIIFKLTKVNCSLTFLCGTDRHTIKWNTNISKWTLFVQELLRLLCKPTRSIVTNRQIIRTIIPCQWKCSLQAIFSDNYFHK